MLFYLNTTFVHVEHTKQVKEILNEEFKYNICTCGAKYILKTLDDLRQFKYNICTCGAER